MSEAIETPCPYDNPIVSQRADPWIYKHADGCYYFTGSVPEYDRIEIRRSPVIGGLGQAETRIVWRKRADGEMSSHIWAPLWTKDGWPVVSPERYARERMQRIPKREIPGGWERLVQLRWIDGQAPSSPLRLLEGGQIDVADGKGNWSFDGDHTLTLTWAEADGRTTAETVLLLPSWDWELNRPALVFTGLDGDGQAVWGKQTSRLAG
ncbi:glycoside hydrolase family 43 protein [Cohnella sp. REN36]|uniref:glycoside hydrolase family 43 protein n=1 Tax=Cohnella sp. REN36 TaxID=2887347 RepID=UPI001D1399A8|nr:glycoside hydrolase family 43 protein [Cohnella sp. REN36]MCC3375029.1 glycoside hydrolase family 43 protein [Cohnella sp. REN36]